MAKAAATDKARKAVTAMKKGSTKKARKIHTSVHFHRPKTLALARKPMYSRKSVPSTPTIDHHAVIKYPLTTEACMKKIEDDNTLVFIVDIRANKHMIKAAVKKLYDVDAVRVNTLVRPDGGKKAFVHIDPAQTEALDVANKIGVI